MTSRRRIFPKLRQIVSFYNILLLSKFEVNLMFQTEVISLRINGGVLYRTFKPPVRAVFQLNIMVFFAQHSKKRQNCTFPKDFSKKHSKSAKIQFFQTLRYNTQHHWYANHLVQLKRLFVEIVDLIKKHISCVEKWKSSKIRAKIAKIGFAKPRRRHFW